MSKPVANVVALVLPLATVYYWFELREPAQVDAARQSTAALASESSAPEPRYCFGRVDDHGIESDVSTECDPAEGSRSADALGQATSSHRGALVATGLDL